MLGDAGGWLTPTLAALRRLGVQVDLARFAWPDDLVVVQLGDLIDKGPDGDHLVAWVDEAMRRAPGRWVQLVGNHEGRVLGGPDFVGRVGCYDLAPATIEILQRWAASGQARLAVALRDNAGEEWLLTHAGLTASTWAELGAPAAALDAAGALEELFGRDPARALRPGSLAGAASEPGVAWATPEELCRGWARQALPFSQLHGHCCAYDFSRQEWRARLPSWLRTVAAAATSPDDRAACHLRVPIGGRHLVGIDPGYGAGRPRWPLVPLVFHDATLLVSDKGDPIGSAGTTCAQSRRPWRQAILHR